MTHEEAHDLLAVFALDAVEADEYEEIEAHLVTCPRCRAELDALRDVAAALGNSVEPLPEGLWSSIASRLPPRSDEEAPPMPVLLRAGQGEPETAPSRFEASGPTRRSLSSRGRVLSVGSIAAAAAVVAAVLGVNLVHDGDQISNLQHASAATVVRTALRTPGHKVVTVEDASHVELAQFVVLPGGQGYLVKSNLPALSSQHTYQLWGVINGHAISLGLLGRAPHAAAFTLAGSPPPSKLGITVEPSSGSVLPTGSMLASGTV
jgi:anti-sigma factor RsiW